MPIVGLALAVGFAGAVLGIGGGFIMVPALLYLFRVPTAVVIGTSQVQVLCTALLAVVLQAYLNGAVDIVLAILLIVGGVFGAQFGARAGRALRADLFRFLLAILVLAVGLRFAIELVVRPAEPFSIYLAGCAGGERLGARRSCARRLAGAAPAAAERLVLSLSSNLVAIGSNYTGARLVAFGIVERDAQSRRPVRRLRRRGHGAGPARGASRCAGRSSSGPIWLNREPAEIRRRSRPSSASYSTRPVAEIMDAGRAPAVPARHRRPSSTRRNSRSTAASGDDPFRAALSG